MDASPCSPEKWGPPISGRRCLKKIRAFWCKSSRLSAQKWAGSLVDQETNVQLWIDFARGWDWGFWALCQLCFPFSPSTCASKHEGTGSVRATDPNTGAFTGKGVKQHKSWVQLPLKDKSALSWSAPLLGCSLHPHFYFYWTFPSFTWASSGWRGNSCSL